MLVQRKQCPLLIHGAIDIEQGNLVARPGKQSAAAATHHRLCVATAKRLFKMRNPVCSQLKHRSPLVQAIRDIARPGRRPGP